MIKDKLGNEIFPDNRVAVAIRDGNVAIMRIGTVTGFGTRKSSWNDGQINTIQIKWDTGIDGYVEEVNSDRIVVLH